MKIRLVPGQEEAPGLLGTKNRFYGEKKVMSIELTKVIFI